MKKVLLATTALIAAAAPAHAELQVTVGGFTAFQAAMYDSPAGSADRDFQTEAQIAVHADATADNGLQYGAKVVLDASTTDLFNADEAGLYLAGAWGRIEMGDDDGASELVVTAPTVGIGQINGSYDDYTGVSPTLPNDRGDHNFTAYDSDDATKVTYYTPKFSGFQAGVSYVPQLNAGETVGFTAADSAVDDVFEVGLGYDGEFNGVQVKLGGNYTFGDTTGAFEDVNAWSAGAQIGYMGFRFGGGYTDNGDSLQATGVGSDNVTGWNLGATYENGPWGVGISYLDMDFGTAAGDATAVTSLGTGTAVGGDYTALVVGGTYAVAPGLNVGADVAWFDRNAVATTGTGVEGDGYVAMVDVTAAF